MLASSPPFWTSGCGCPDALSQPRKRALHHPSPCRIDLPSGVLLGSIFIGWDIASSGIALDVRLVALGSRKLSYVLGVVGFVGAQMLFFVSGTFERHRDDQLDRGDLVVAIGTSEYDRERSATLIDQEVDLGASLAPICGICTGFASPKRSSKAL